MEPSPSPTNSESRYQKLAAEYSKLRASASVLKKAVLDEQEKSQTLREQLRLKESTQRRLEQENDSLNFRNRQLESRVHQLQTDFELQNKVESRFDQGVLEEELQKKITQNETLNMKIFELQDKEDELTKLIQKYKCIEDELEAERKMRQELVEQVLALKAKDHQTNNIPAQAVANCSTNGEDVNLVKQNDDLKKELIYWKCQHELMKIRAENFHISDVEIIYQKFQEKFQQLFENSLRKESQVNSLNLELHNLQAHLELAQLDLDHMKARHESTNQQLKNTEDDLTTTRLNYEEQISVLTEQVISLSEQLAAVK